MEPNVDRGMWSVVVLLAAIVIGGVVLLAFPKISGKIVNNMDDTVSKAFEGKTPSWVNETTKDNEMIEFKDEIAFLKEMSNLNFQKVEAIDYRFQYNFKSEPVIKYKNHEVDEWGVEDATYVNFDVADLKEDKTDNVLFVDNRSNTHADRNDEIAVVGLIKNTGESSISIKNHPANKRVIVKPGETKFVNLFGGYKAGSNPDQTKYYQVNFGSVEENKKTELTYYGMFLVKGADDIAMYKSKLNEYNLK